MKVVVTKSFNKKMKLTYRDNCLFVEANWHLPIKEIEKLIQQNYSWVLAQKTTNTSGVGVASQTSSDNAFLPMAKKSNSFKLYDSLSIRWFLNYQKTLISGEEYNVESTKSSKAYIDSNTLYIPEKQCTTKEHKGQAVNSYLRRISLNYLSREISNIGCRLSLCPLKIQVGSMHFWTNCKLASQKIICLNYKCIQLPNYLRELIITHTFLHFLYPVHNDNFFAQLQKLLPNYPSYKEELENYDFLLEL